MSTLKTQQTDRDPAELIAAIENAGQREDCQTLYAMLERITARPGSVWGSTMIGFGRYHYTYASGHSGSWFLTGFAPRKRDLTVYVMPGFNDYSEQLEGLGRYKLGKSCLYLKRLSDIDPARLEALLSAAVQDMRGRYTCD